MYRVWIAILFLLPVFGWHCGVLRVLLADDTWKVGRSTNDRDADLVQALMDRQRFDDALAVCRLRGRGADPQSDTSAKWAIYQSRVLAARQLGSPRFEDAEVQAAARPVRDLLAAYPEHRRRLFLQAQDLMVDRAAAVHRVLRATIAPKDTTARDEATVSLLRVTGALELLGKEVGDTRVILDQQADARPYDLIEDLSRLQQELQVESVSLAVLQTELFPAGSDDSIAAATRAEQIAVEAIARLPSDTKARREVERLRIESIVRSQQYDRADQELAPLLGDESTPLDARWLSLQIRLDMSQQRMASAGDRIDRYYGEDPVSAPRSIEMDLARLEFLLRSDPNAAAGDWLDAIESRGGTYARRRAEAMALSLLGRSSSSARPAIDPAIVAAQGQDYLRRGEPGRAAELLAASAAAETQPDRAVTRAAEAAAAFGAVQQHEQAAAVLAETAIANPSAQQAPAAHLQAAVLIASHQPQSVQRLESMLRLNLEQWPDAATSAPVRSWLQKLLNAQERYVDAAEITTALPANQVASESIDAMVDQWRLVFRSATDDASKVSRRFLAAYQPLLDQPIASEAFPLLASLLVTREDLGTLTLSPEMIQAHPFASALIDYRRQAVESDALYQPPADVAADATERLMRDGRENPSIRTSVAGLLARWDGDQTHSLTRAERLLWAGQVDAAIKECGDLINAEPANAEVVRNAAKLLQSSSDRRAVEEAIRLWDQLAAGTIRGGAIWHDAKLAAIAALRQTGNVDESKRRAKYILLTVPDLDEKVRQEYERFAN